MDKRHAYDFDTRVPFLVRGPGVQPGSVMSSPATHVDLAPTLLDIAGVLPAEATMIAPMDGRSLLPLLITDAHHPNLGQRAKSRLEAAGDAAAYAARWRRAVLIEHLFWTTNIKCVSNCTFRSATTMFEGRYPRSDVWCADVRALATCWVR